MPQPPVDASARVPGILCLGAAALGLLVAGAAAAHEAPGPGAPPDPAALFEPPAPGSYELPPIRRVRDHVLLDPAGADAPLLGLGPGQVALVAFVYRSCTDTSGCPAALGALKRLDGLLAERPAVAPRARLVTVSFDPAHDTPAQMAELRDRMAPRADWRFLTAPGPAVIEPVLADFGQDAMRDPDTEWLIHHVLKVFLVDASGRVRNVYSAGFLDPRILLHDVLTVLAEG